jgi:hypothetical protein
MNNTVSMIESQIRNNGGQPDFSQDVEPYSQSTAPSYIQTIQAQILGNLKAKEKS